MCVCECVRAHWKIIIIINGLDSNERAAAMASPFPLHSIARTAYMVTTWKSSPHAAINTYIEITVSMHPAESGNEFRLHRTFRGSYF